METPTQEQQAAVNDIYNYAANLFITHKKSYGEVVEALVTQGAEREFATTIASQLEEQMNAAKKSRAQKDMLYGALWCIGGTVLTLAHIGFIFWGAIVFGAVQFFKGVINL
jgi:hypothetical protein